MLPRVVDAWDNSERFKRGSLDGITFCFIDCPFFEEDVSPLLYR